MISKLGKFWKRFDEELLGSPEETMGFSRDLPSLKQSFLIKKYDFSSLEQIEDIKKELLGRRILIINVKTLLQKVDVTKLKRGIEDMKSFLRENGGSMARIGDEYLILTPNSFVKIAN